MNNHDLIFRIILIGDPSVGKTCLINKYCNDTFDYDHHMTVGVDFAIKYVPLNIDKNIIIKTHIWDTAGQESFKSVTRSYYRNSMGVILCYDTSRLVTFNYLDDWIDEIKRYCPSNCKIMLVGTKIDLEKKVITTGQGKQLADKHNLLFNEVSAKSNINVNESFMTLITEIYKINNLNNLNNLNQTTDNDIKSIYVLDNERRYCC